MKQITIPKESILYKAIASQFRNCWVDVVLFHDTWGEWIEITVQTTVNSILVKASATTYKYDMRETLSDSHEASHWLEEAVYRVYKHLAEEAFQDLDAPTLREQIENFCRYSNLHEHATALLDLVEEEADRNPADKNP